MASLTAKLSVSELEKLYGNEKPYYEFWDGVPIQKSMPNWMHGFLQILLGQLLLEAGYKVASEVRLKIDPAFQPLPDVIATRLPIQLPYPTSAIEIVAEILSDDEPLSRVLTKCKAYARWGCDEIYVIDPQTRTVFRWLTQQGAARLEEVDTIASIPATRLWSQLDAELS